VTIASQRYDDPGTPACNRATDARPWRSFTDARMSCITARARLSAIAVGGGFGRRHADSTTGDPEIYPCQSANRCEENEHCTPEARQNADIAGETPRGPFKGTFAFASAAIAFGDLGNVYVLPEYMTDLCAAAPMLVIQLGYTQGQGGTFEAPVAIDDGQGQLVQTTATVHVGACCNIMWFCDCESPSPYELEITVTGDGWSLAGTARPNCCRSYSIDEAA
jgi:hypothetical protein